MPSQPCPDGMQGGSERFPATDMEARAAIARITAALRQQGWPSDFLGSVEIVLAETLNNVVEHAYRGRNPGEVAIDFDLAGDGLWLTVRDRGAPFESDRPPAGQPVDLAVARAQLPEGGFGWHLIRALTDEVRYSHANGVNTLMFRMALPG